MKSIPTLELERDIAGIVAGIDEAGRGPLAGPVVAAAVVIPNKFHTFGINDSKKLNHAQRNELFHHIIEHCPYGVGIASVEEIDELNILQSTLLAMQKAALALPTEVDCFLVDGNTAPKINNSRVYTVIKGDSKSTSIAAASIVAKVTRDIIMEELHQQFPQYCWDENYGYATKKHREAILTHGPCLHHRKLFIRNILSIQRAD